MHRGGPQGRPELLAESPMNTRSLARGACAALCLLAAGVLATPALAEQVNDTTNPLNVNSRLNFSLVYPGFLSFRVGTTGAAVNLLDFSVPAAQVGSGTPIAGTGGDAGPSGVNVSILGNNGQVTITPTNNSGGLGIGTGVPADGRINYNQIGTTTSVPQFPAPVLANAGGAAVTPTLNSALVTQRTAVWTFSYLNQTIPSAGTYGGAGGVNGGRVTYTATMP
jgi:hypothetical protein